MKRATLPVLLAVAAVAVPVATAAGQRHAASTTAILKFTGKQKVATGFFRGRTIRYLDFGPVKLKVGNKLAPIWVVTNGVKGQSNIIDTVPGQKGYSPLWQVSMVTWRDGVTRRVLRSAADVRAAAKAGELTIRRTATVVNCPVLGFGQKRVQGFFQEKTVEYYDLGPVKLRPGNKVAPIWGFTNGAQGQRNVIDTVPGDAAYTPLWKVTMATWADGVTPRVLRSANEVKAAAADGEVTLRQTSTIVNCPVL